MLELEDNLKKQKEASTRLEEERANLLVKVIIIKLKKKSTIIFQVNI